MEKKQPFEQHLSRRIMGDDGLWTYFCRSCGKYRPETEFYKKKGRPFGLDSRCKLHFNRKDEDDDKSMEYLKLNPLSEDDFKETQEFLVKLGYDFNSKDPIHVQFEKKHGLHKKS